MDPVFVARARQLRAARELFLDDDNLASATALLSVHSGIALNDALLNVWTGKPLKGRDHQAAIVATQKACKARKVDATGVKHLAELLRSKSAISYGDKSVTRERAAALAVAARRFEAWTFKTCKEIAQWEQQQSARVG